MGAEAAQGVNLRLDVDVLAEDGDLFDAIDEQSPERSVRLVPDDEHVGLWISQVVTEMMQDASRGTHARARHDEARPGHRVDRHRFLRRRGELQRGEVLLDPARLEVGDHLLIEQFLVMRVDARCFDGHRAVEKDRESRDQFLPENGSQQRRQQLRPAHRKSRHQHLAFFRHGLLHDLDELVDRVCIGLVIVVAIGRLEEDEIGLLERIEILQDRRAHRAEVTGGKRSSSARRPHRRATGSRPIQACARPRRIGP